MIILPDPKIKKKTLKKYELFNLYCLGSRAGVIVTFIVIVAVALTVIVTVIAIVIVRMVIV